MKKATILAIAALALPFSVSAQELISGFNFGQFYYGGTPNADATFEEILSIGANWSAGNPPPIDSTGGNFNDVPYSNGTGTASWNTGVTVVEYGFNSVAGQMIDGSGPMALVGDSSFGAALQFGTSNTATFQINTLGYTDFAGFGAIGDIGGDGISDNLIFSAQAVAGPTTINWSLVGFGSLGQTVVSSSGPVAFSLDLDQSFYGLANATLVATFSGGSGVILDNVQFNGTVIPEPTTYAALLGLVSFGIAALRRRKSIA